jgi:hypothetical protein
VSVIPDKEVFIRRWLFFDRDNQTAQGVVFACGNLCFLKCWLPDGGYLV